MCLVSPTPRSEPIGEEPAATVTTGNATIKSSTEVSLSGSFVLVMRVY